MDLIGAMTRLDSDAIRICEALSIGLGVASGVCMTSRNQL